MRINSDKLRQLAAMNDDALWAEIMKMGRNFGLSVPSKTPSHEDMERIRSAISGSNINLGEAITLLRNYGGKM